MISCTAHEEREGMWYARSLSCALELAQQLNSCIIISVLVMAVHVVDSVSILYKERWQVN